VVVVDFVVVAVAEAVLEAEGEATEGEVAAMEDHGVEEAFVHKAVASAVGEEVTVVHVVEDAVEVEGVSVEAEAVEVEELLV